MFNKQISLLLFVSIGMCYSQSKWTSENSGVTNNLYSITYGNSQFVAVGDSGTILTSADGQKWSKQNSGTTCLFSSVVYGNSRFVAVGDSGMIMNSVDGLTWKRSIKIDTIYAYGKKIQLTSPDFIVDTLNARLRSVVYQDSQFIAVGGGNEPESEPKSEKVMLSSAGGTAWDYGCFCCYTADFYFILNGNGRSVIVVGNHVLTNDVIWTDQPMIISGSPHLTSGAFGNGQFVTVGDSGLVCSSIDGITWTTNNLGNYFFNSITTVNSLFVITGAAGAILTSPNDTTWTPRNSGTSCDLNYCTYGNGLFIIVGNKGSILSSNADNEVFQPGLKRSSVNVFKINNNRTNIALFLPQFSGPITIGLFNTAGRKIYSTSHLANNSILNIPISGILTGTYLLSIKGKNTSFSSSLIVTK